MAENNGNPQLEDGFVRIATELYEALARIRIPGEARQVLDVIIRKTYGFNKKQDWISLSQFMAATGLIKPHVQRALRRLIKMNMVTKKGSLYKPTYSLQKLYGRWQGEPKKVRGNQIGCHRVTKKGSIGEPNRVTTIDTLTKDTSTINTRSQKRTQNSQVKSPHSLLIKHFCDRHQQVFDIPYQFSGGKDGKIIKSLLTTYKDHNLIMQMMDMFFDPRGTGDTWIDSTAHKSIGVFASVVNKLAQAISEPSYLSGLSDTGKQMARSLAAAKKELFNAG